MLNGIGQVDVLERVTRNDLSTAIAVFGSQSLGKLSLFRWGPSTALERDSRAVPWEDYSGRDWHCEEAWQSPFGLASWQTPRCSPWSGCICPHAPKRKRGALARCPRARGSERRAMLHAKDNLRPNWKRTRRCVPDHPMNSICILRLGGRPQPKLPANFRVAKSLFARRNTGWSALDSVASVSRRPATQTLSLWLKV